MRPRALTIGGVGELDWVGVLDAVDLEDRVDQRLEFFDDAFDAQPGGLLDVAGDVQSGEHDG